MDYLALAEHGAAIAGTVVMTASAICAATKTPDPATKLGKAYRAIEILGLLVGQAKTAGIIPSDAKADQLGAEAAGLAKAVLAAPTP